jgi:hypothetical protein
LKIAMLPSLFGKGWGGKGDPSLCEVATPITLSAFAQPQDTDAMALMYLVPGAPSFPRLNVGALEPLKANGQEPELHWAMFDIDNLGHLPWRDLDAAACGLDKAIDICVRAGLPTPRGYTTPSGLRLMWHLSPPLPVSKANAFLRGLGDKAKKLDVDPASYEWTRLMRLPRAKRDGQVLDSWTELEGDTLDPYSLGIDLDAVQAKVHTASWGDAPPEPCELGWHDWKHTADMPWAHMGQPVPGDDKGSSYGMCRTALGRIAQRGGYDDAHKLASFLWASTLATEGTSLDIAELWKMACWTADAQATANAAPAPSTTVVPEATPLTSEEWELVAKGLRGKASVHLSRLRDGQRLTTSKPRYIEVTLAALRTLAETTSLPADTMYRAFYRTCQLQRTPPVLEVWERCLLLVEERDSGGEDNEAMRKVFTQRFPLTLATPFGAGQLFQLNTSTTPYSYLPTNDRTIEMDFLKSTRPGLPFDADIAGMNVRQVLARYGSRVESVSYVSGQDGCRYDPDRQAVTVGVHQLAPCTPTYHEQVHEWLALLGGTDVEGLYDWLSCVTYTQNSPVCALYLDGGAGIGKSLLARGISSLWGSGPVDYNKVMVADVGNDDMTQCPLLFADEGIIVNKKNESTASMTFRTVTAGTDHRIRALYKGAEHMQAAMRVLICANPTADGLPFKESLGPEGINAITKRVMYIRADDAAEQYLLFTVGIETQGEVWAPMNNQPGHIAEHLLWLRDSRKVTKQPGQRFLVQGKETEWHRQFGARQGIKPGVLQVVYALLIKVQSGMPVGDLRLKDDPEARVVWVHLRTVQGGWDSYARSYRAKPAQVKDALEQLASEKRVVRDGDGTWQGYALPYQSFVDAAVCDLEDFNIN